MNKNLLMENEIKNYRRNILLTLDKLVDTDDERFNEYFKLYQKIRSTKNVIEKYYGLKSLNTFMSNTLNDKYVMFRGE